MRNKFEAVAVGEDGSTDDELVRAFLQGDEAAFVKFITRHQHSITRFACMWLNDASLAADAVQETFLRCYTGFSRFRFGAAPKTWLARICRNVCLETNRRQRDRARGTYIEPTDVVDPNSDPSEVADTQWLRGCLAQLPQRQKEVVTLRLLEELSVAETAKIMGCRQGTVKAHLHKALANLKHLVEDQGELDHE